MPQAAPNKPRATLLKEVVRDRVWPLQRSLLNTEPPQAAAQAMLAQLRRCQPGSVGLNPEVWETTLGDLPDVLVGHCDGASPAEMAIHASLVLYAIHQQSQREPMHVNGVGLGLAVQRLARARAMEGDEFDESVIKKFHQVALASEWDGRIHHLRGLVSLMRGAAVPLDYGLLAADLWYLADPRRDPSSVLTAWGRGLHARPKKDSSGEEK